MAERERRREAPAVLIVTEDGVEAARLAAGLHAEGVTPIRVNSREAAVNVLDQAPVDALVTRLRAPRIPGLQLVALVRQRNPEAGAVLIIDRGEEEPATRAMSSGVIDFQTRPVNVEKVRAVLTRLFTHQSLLDELSRASRRLDLKFGFAGVLGNSSAMVHVVSQLKAVAPLEVGVLIIGESGTGRDFIARAIHLNSPRRNAPFVRLDCRALPPRLLAGELFGTASRRSRARQPGRIELSSSGTLYLEEVGHLPADAQGRVSEALRAGQVRPALEGPPVEIDVRAIASTANDPSGLVGEGRMHPGLWSILSEAQIELPPLRHRRRDVPLLSRHFLSEFCREERRVLTLSRAAVDVLQRYDWPGNVRELRGVIHDIVEGGPVRGTLGVADLPPDVRAWTDRGGAERAERAVSLREVERRLIEEAIRASGGNREKAARILGIGVRTLYRKIKTYGGFSAGVQPRGTRTRRSG